MSRIEVEVCAVATPLEWDELDARGLRADWFTIRDVGERLVKLRA
ncbi:hypothetical protein [Mycobacterium sp.]|nr:hypothetical protein [Mycobacterium sp.]